MAYPVNSSSNSVFASVVAFALVSLVAVFLLDPIPQDLSYHAFADTKNLLGIPNSLNVLSNIPFLIVGVYGFYVLLRLEQETWHPAWVAFFVGVFLVGLGSSYYHLAPDNATLVWDRLPMTIGFMGLFVALLSELSGVRLGRGTLAAAILAGGSSVAYWAVNDDLRFYVWVQFMPLGAVAILLLFGGARFSHSSLLGLALLSYVAAKLTEFFDGAIFFAFSGFVSGHTFKHLFAAGGCYILILYLQKRALMPGRVHETA